MNTAVKVTIIGGLSLIISVFMVLNWLEKKEQVRLEVLDLNQRKLDDCYLEAGNTYISSWNTICYGRGLGEDCTLPANQGYEINDTYENDKKNCVELYK